MSTIAEMCSLGLSHHQAGRLNEAEQIYRQILDVEPSYADALHLLGVVFFQQRKYDLAVESISRAIALKGTEAAFHSNLGNVLLAQGKPERATAAYRRALDLTPDDAEVHSNLGTAFQAQGKLDDALKSYRQALSLKPDTPVTHDNLGTALHTQGKLDEAIDSYRKALELEPNSLEALFHLGSALKDQGRLEEASLMYQRAEALDPEFVAVHRSLIDSTDGASGPIDTSATATASQKHAAAPAHEALAVAIGHHKSGRLQIAEQIYRQILAADPKHAQALHLTGLVAFQQGRYDDAASYLRQAVALKHDDLAIHSNLGVVLKAQGNLGEAIACFRRALELNPLRADVHVYLGTAFQAQGKLDEAESCFRRALELKPNDATFHHHLGSAFQAQTKLDEALSCFRRAIELDPDHADAHNNLGHVLQMRGKLDDAVGEYRRSLQLRPENTKVRNNLGTALQAQGKLAEAIDCYRVVLRLNPDHALAHCNLGAALQAQGNLDESIDSYRRALALNPNFAEAHSNLGNALKDQGSVNEAITSFRRAIELKPDYLTAHRNLLFTLGYCPGVGQEAIYEEHRRWNRQWAAPLANEIMPHTNDATPNRRLRIGYVSPDFRTHCQALFTLPLFTAHNRQQYEIVCYADVTFPDGVTDRLRNCVDHWRDIVGLTDDELARLIRQDQIDILVDLTMHMERGHLLTFARKPAPVQVCWLAYPGTTGLETIDYRLTDPYLDPPGLTDRFYSEQSIRLPDCFWCYRPLTAGPPVKALPASIHGHVTFGCLNNFCKVNPAVLELWARVLSAVDRSRLLLLAPEGSARRSALEILKSADVSSDRVTFVGRQPLSTYMELYHQIDIGLDTFPYNGHTTSLDSFWMGVPVVTLVGHTVVGRAGLCQLQILGLPELIAHTPDQFVDIAAGLATDLRRLHQLRASLRQRMEKSPLMDAPRFARHIEAAYRHMWQTWCATRGQSSPASAPGR